MTKSPLTREWITKLAQCNQLYVGFSGGLDSTVLLHALSKESSLFKKLVAVHVNHGISPHASSWQQDCKQTAESLQIPFMAFKPDFSRNANLEENARIARLQVFSSLIKKNDALILAHHRDDQAETLLLNLFRGAGIDGMTAMPAEKPFGKGVLFRPLLQLTRKQLETYATEHHLSWIQDESNLDLDYSRNFIRHQIMPLLTTKWPSVVSNLNRTSLHCQEAKYLLNDLAWLDAKEQSLENPVLSLDTLKHLSQARLTNVIRTWLRMNGVRLFSTKRFQILLNDLVFSRTSANPSFTWDNVVLKRYHRSLYLLPAKSTSVPKYIEWVHFPSALAIKGIGWLQASATEEGLCIPKESVIEVRFRQGGETFKWHKQTKSLKKLWQEWNVPPWQRDAIPLLYVNGQLAAVVGFAVSDDFYSQGLAWSLELIR
ncbi:tRNA lysidine(34) synthetase TilS [Legionella impletisoli]|uniref:tRNA(Ile)-lysidine synthase n=1 Tax=Legionella impletisoli TaxID=343510 RepID=A0A917JQE6_9GAMM|nr:tRNA lysidine(34) synthetase TilS [Legionella impletisoli]GGI80217.1 tRNA(Ile)-lysidine synthase [Legionella impletisoli]